MAHVQYMSALERYKNSGIRRVKILTADDDKVCDVCKEESVKEYTLDTIPTLPFHPNCRCCIAPII